LAKPIDYCDDVHILSRQLETQIIATKTQSHVVRVPEAERHFVKEHVVVVVVVVFVAVVAIAMAILTTL
jgi:hypothetical protein